ncbi:MAG: 3-hydroxyacyl-CoA dehydrogenase family protein [Deltaproteobacteria bacterium]|nr:3-hydroxyacyl-CoA dehydrogenase family protein [Deltaproteobacteria bacterium]MBW1845960.1 3-hydroxyacyl-CoA dehydrogenase family protein [Deltaproteobacteria bacterium]MBW2179663.1 3-hydroxyacyl-CoA dehydrogenase family protein [Deltaproteobacteria bacterium]MBW2363678.1 3-hydroxyacyl-CoA dehydrogenase family protein [Deltaproteobacteria bacterium]
MKNEINTITVIGAGMMGVQIIARAAVFGSNANLYHYKPEAMEKARHSVISKIERYRSAGMVEGTSDESISRVTLYEDLQPALEKSDLVIECVPERLELKKQIFSEIDKIAPPDCIISTNSSSIPVTRIEDSVGRKDKVANIHFYAPIPKNNFVDLMKGTSTDNDTFEKITAWIKKIKCVPLIVKKECMGFVFNRVWRSVKKDALASWAGGHADFKDIDRGWMIFTGMQIGPFGMMDSVGLDVVYDVEMEYFYESGDEKDRPPLLLKKMIENKQLGRKTGKGFYDWNDPEFSRPDFLK